MDGTDAPNRMNCSPCCSLSCRDGRKFIILASQLSAQTDSRNLRSTALAWLYFWMLAVNRWNVLWLRVCVSPRS